MCADEKIPVVNRVEFIESMLEAYEQTSDECRDVFALDARVLGTPSEVVDNLNDYISNMDVPGLQERLLNRGRIRIPYELPSDY